jgi:hypothetical protein
MSGNKENRHKLVKEAREWLDENYPENGVHQGKDEKNRGNRRGEIKELDISNENLMGSLKFTGFAELYTLKCSSQHLTSLDVVECLKLEKLDCSDNELTELVVGKCSNLKELNCSINQLTSLNVEGLDKLKEINCSANKISELELSSNISLESLSCQDNNTLKKIVGLEKLRKSLTYVSTADEIGDSKAFKFLDNELGENIDKAKVLLNNYKKLMEHKNEYYEKIKESDSLFNQDEKEKSGNKKKEYLCQIEDRENGIKFLNENKWKWFYE